MTQHATLSEGAALFQLQLPSADAQVLPGVAWGAVEAFPTPAYWAYQVWARRVREGSAKHKLANTLAEEVCACLLGGYGIPAEIGLAAFRTLRDLGVLSTASTSEEIRGVLSQPMCLQGRMVRYRFARQKALYLSAALQLLTTAPPNATRGRELRDWLLQLPGLGFKTASWVSRNYMDADDVAILDVHVIRAGVLTGFLDKRLTVERHYLQLEEQFLRFARGIGTRPSELDAVIWSEMRSSPRTVAALMPPRSPALRLRPDASRAIRRAHKRRSHARQTRLVE